MKRRAHGSGTIEMLPSGRYRVKLPGTAGIRETLGPFATRDEAERALDAAAADLAEARMGVAGGATLRGYGSVWLDQRERSVRDVRCDRSRWERHVLTAHFADWPIASIRRRDVRRWLDGLGKKRAINNHKELSRRLSPRTVQRCLDLLRCCLQDCVDDELIAANPAKDLRVKGKIVDEWTYLSPEEQQAIAGCKVIDEPDKLRILFAIGTGLRKGEQWNLELADVHASDDDPHVLVRYGGPNRQPPKRDKVRRVPLFGIALDAARRWLELLPSNAPKNAHRLMWPTSRGARRQVTKDYGWREQRRAAGISRHVRWHDLRHTCGSSLVAGWWGRRWSLIEVRDLLGHSSVTVTERYAHLAESALQHAADETRGGNGPRIVHDGTKADEIATKRSGFLNHWPQVRLLPGAPKDSQDFGDHTFWSLGLSWDYEGRRHVVVIAVSFQRLGPLLVTHSWSRTPVDGTADSTLQLAPSRPPTTLSMGTAELHRFFFLRFFLRRSFLTFVLTSRRTSTYRAIRPRMSHRSFSGIA